MHQSSTYVAHFARSNTAPRRFTQTAKGALSRGLQRLFLEHPCSIGETYFEHQRSAFLFGGMMLVAGFACLLHGVLPALFQHTGSQAVSKLYRRMRARRSAARTANRDKKV